MNYFKILFFLLALPAFSQKPTITKDFTVSVGEKYKHINAENEYHFQYKQSLLSLKKVRKSFIIERHSLTNLNKRSNNTAISDKGKFVGILQLKDTVLVFSRNKNKLIAQKLLITQPKVSSPYTFLDTKKTINDDFGFSSRFGYETGNRINAFAIKKSVDGSKFVVLYTDKEKSDTTEKPTNVINIQVYNTDMTLDWKRSMPLPYYYKQMNADDFMIDNEGTFYVLASKFEKERVSNGKRNKLDTDFHMEIFTTSKKNPRWTISKVSTEKSIEDAVLYISSKNKPIIIGFYGEKEYKGYVTGAFNALITPNKNIDPQLHPIDIDTINAYASRKKTQEKKGLRPKKDIEDLENIHINKIITNADGSFVILAEQRYAIQNTHYLNGASSTTFQFHYRNAYACKMDGKGTLNWFLQLPKNQLGLRGKQAMSFIHQYFKNNHYIIYWDKFKNIYTKTGDCAELVEMHKPQYMFISAFKINSLTGETEKLPIVNSSELKKYRLSSFNMGKVITLSNADLIIEGHNGRGKNYLFRLKGN